MEIRGALSVWVGLLPGIVQAAEIEPTWESLAANYRVPD